MDPTPDAPVRWPAQGLSAPLVAEVFTLRDRAFETPYHLPWLAVHLYGYAGEMRFDGVPQRLEAGDLTLTPPGVETRYRLARPGSHWCLHVPVPAAAGAQLALPRHHRLGDAATQARERLARIIDHHRRARGEPGGPATVAAAAAVLELMAWLAERERPAQADGRAEQAVQRAAAELRLHPERSWRVERLAAHVGLSPAHLARRFRARFGHTLARYQLIQRVGAAQALLACTEEAVGTIGARVGLPDPHHFNKLFRRIAGCPPSEFRARHRGGR